eukprot:GFYU01026010.1.p1 GENE.GFYU01026010.1~~GFYU01026010.1.p1  ORF type:complete len:134 (-),score=27.47 GFYU01026010.1:101-502(-)
METKQVNHLNAFTCLVLFFGQLIAWRYPHWWMEPFFDSTTFSLGSVGHIFMMWELAGLIGVAAINLQAADSSSDGSTAVVNGSFAYFAWMAIVSAYAAVSVPEVKVLFWCVPALCALNSAACITSSPEKGKKR